MIFGRIGSFKIKKAMGTALLTAVLVLGAAAAFPKGVYAETVIPAAAEDADSYVVVHSNDGELGFREGPGGEYASAGPSFRNGDVLHITKTVTASSGNPWGLTTDASGTVTGWVALVPTDPATPAQITSYMEAAASSRIEQQMSALTPEQLAQAAQTAQAAASAETQQDAAAEQTQRADGTAEPAAAEGNAADTAAGNPEVSGGATAAGGAALLENIGREEIQTINGGETDAQDETAPEEASENTVLKTVFRIFLALFILLIIGAAFLYVRERNKRRRRRYSHSPVRRR